MNPDEVPSPVPSYIMSLLRTLGALLGGWLIAKGYITAEQAPIIGGGVLAVIIAVASLYSKVRANKALAAAIAAPSGKAS